MNPNCSTHFQKAYILVLVSLLQVLCNNKSDNPWENALVKDIVHIMAKILKWATNDVLRTALLLTSPLLRIYPVLSTSFVRGIMALGINQRTEILQIPIDKKTRHIIYWDLPFLLNNDKVISHDGWWCLNVLMGACRMVPKILNLDGV